MGWNNIQKKFQQKTQEGIKVGFWNKGGALQSLHEKINEIEHLIKSNNFGIFGVIEANFFKDNDVKDIEINGFSVFWDKGRNNISRQNARCVVYVRNDLSCKLKENLMDEKIPEIWLEVGEPRKRHVLMCIFYREFSEWNSRMSTNSIKCQKERFEKWLSKVSMLLEKDKETWLLGDFNLDLTRKEENQYDRKWLAVLAQEELGERGMVQLIDKPTHTQQNRKSVIDLIFTNDPRKVSASGTPSMSSEYECVFMIRKSKIITRKQEFVKRSFKNFNLDDLPNYASRGTMTNRKTMTKTQKNRMKE